jgi:hypothetical protein
MHFIQILRAPQRPEQQKQAIFCGLCCSRFVGTPEQRGHHMRLYKSNLVGLGLAAVIGIVVWRMRPARIRWARITDIAPGAPPVAHVALAYGQGARPISVIIDVCGQNGEGGSATLAGERQYAEIPLYGAADGRYTLMVTATYRIFGRSYTAIQAFERQNAFGTEVGN